MTYAAIHTKYLGPTNFKGSRVTAWCDWGDETKRLTIGYDPAKSTYENHEHAAMRLAVRLGIFGQWSAGEDRPGYTFVRNGGAGFDLGKPA